jgi:hypothetical protein
MTKNPPRSTPSTYEAAAKIQNSASRSPQMSSGEFTKSWSTKGEATPPKAQSQLLHEETIESEGPFINALSANSKLVVRDSSSGSLKSNTRPNAEESNGSNVSLLRPTRHFSTSTEKPRRESYHSTHQEADISGGTNEQTFHARDVQENAVYTSEDTSPLHSPSAHDDGNIVEDSRLLSVPPNISGHAVRHRTSNVTRLPPLTPDSSFSKQDANEIPARRVTVGEDQVRLFTRKRTWEVIPINELPGKLVLVHTRNKEASKNSQITIRRARDINGIWPKSLQCQMILTISPVTEGKLMTLPPWWKSTVTLPLLPRQILELKQRFTALRMLRLIRVMMILDDPLEVKAC